MVPMTHHDILPNIFQTLNINWKLASYNPDQKYWENTLK